MAEENENLKPLQVEICKPEPKPEQPDKICPTCIPDENYIAPDWWEQEAPFLNEKTCEYSVSVTINSKGDTYTTSDMTNVSSANLRSIMKTYVRPGVILMLKHYDKLISDEVVCGAPPDSIGGFCKDISSIDYEDAIDDLKNTVLVDGRKVTTTYGTATAVSGISTISNVITNPKGLELYARASDYYYASPNQSLLQVLITIPAFIFDQVPRAPRVGEPDVDVEETIVDARKFRRQLAQLKHLFAVFSKYQSYFYQYENGNLSYEKNGKVKTIYLKYMDDKLDMFENGLEELIDSNGYSWSTFGFATKRITDIKFIFNKENEERPFEIEKIQVRSKGCDFVDLTVGLETFKNRPVVSGQTITGYVAQINDMEKSLNSRETPPWIDFVVQYTFPKVGVNYGMSQYTVDAVGSCIGDSLSKIDDYVLDTVLSFQTAFAYQLNKENCKLLSQLNLSDPMNPSSEKAPLAPGQSVSNAAEKFKKKLKKDFTKNTAPLVKLMKDLSRFRKNNTKTPLQKLGKALSMLDPCKWKEVTKHAIKCIMAGMDIRKVYLTFIKKTLASLTGAGLELLLSGLPRDKYDRVMEIVRKEFKDMPMPWDTNYKPGEIPEPLLDKMATRRLEEDLQNLQKYTDAQGLYDDSIERLKQLGIDMAQFVSDIDLPRKEEKALNQLSEELDSAGIAISDDYDEYSEYRDDAEAAVQEMRSVYQEAEALQINYTRQAYDEFFAITTNVLNTEKKRILDTLRDMQQKYQLLSQEYDQLFPLIEEGPVVSLDYQDSSYLYDEVVSEIIKENNSSYWKITGYNGGDDPSEYKLTITQAKWSKDGKKFKSTVTDKNILSNLANVVNSKAQESVDSLKKQAKDKLNENMQRINIVESEMAKLQSSAREDKLFRYAPPKEKILSSQSSPQFSSEVTWGYNPDTVIKTAEGFDDEGLRSALESEVDVIRAELTNAAKAQYRTDIDLASNVDYMKWDKLSPEDKEKAIEQEKDRAKRGFYKLEPGEQPSPGTLGKALGSVQKAVVAVMIEAILETATMNDIMTAMDNLPGSKLIGAFLATFKCPNTHLLWPPIDTFLNTLTFDPCGPGNTGLALPKIPKPGKLTWSIWKALREAFKYALYKTIESVIMALLMKIAKLIDSALCKAMGLPFKLIQNGLSSDPQSFGTIVDELMCGKKPNTKKEKDSNIAHAIEHAAGKPKAVESTSSEEASPVENAPRTTLSNTNPQTQDIDIQNQNIQPELGKYKELSTLLSNIATKDELITAMTSDREEQDVNLMRNISNIVKIKMPEYASAFADTESTIDFFVACGNLISPDQRAALREARQTPDGNFPINKSSCLTSDQKQQWDYNRREAFINAGLSPELAAEHIDKMNDRRSQDFADAIDALILSPQDEFDRAINDLLRPTSKDPDCGLPTLFDPEPGPTKEEIKEITDGLFAGIQASFIDDLLESNYFSSFFGLNAPGIISQILADKSGFTLNFHNFLNDNKFFRWVWTQDWNPPPLPVPETVAIKMREKLLESIESDSLYEYPYDPTPGPLWKEKPSVKLQFSNGVEKNPYKSKLLMYEVLKDRDGNIKQNFNYKLKIRSPYLNKTFTVEKLISGEEVQTIEDLEPSEYVTDQYKSNIFANFISRQYEKVMMSPDIKIFSLNESMNKMKQLMYGDFIGLASSGPNGGTPEGHLYGDQDILLTSDDLEYVGPNGEEYDYDEEEMVLGRSKTNNPRVKFLDPAIHGGSYTDPFKYIESTGDCGGQRGWMKLGRVLSPDVVCGEQESNFLYINNILDRIQKTSGLIEPHEQLAFDPECVLERPFDKIASPRTLANIEGAILATIRVHIIDFIISAMPTLSNIALDFGKNYDEGLSEYILYRLQRACRDEISFFARSKYEGDNYYMLFLEQAAQAVIRMVDNGDFGEVDEDGRIQNKELQDAVDKIKKVRDNYNLDDMVIKNQGKFADPTFAGVGALGVALLFASGPIGLAVFAAALPVKFVVGKIEKNIAKYAYKLMKIRDNQEACKVLLKYLIRDQLNFYRDELSLKLEPRPYIGDITKFFLGKSNIFQSQEYINAGTTDIEIPVGGGQVPNPTYGFIRNVVDNTSINPLSLDTFEFSGAAAKHGAFYFEKYVRLSSPVSNNIDLNLSNAELAKKVLLRPLSLQGVVNIQSFKKYLNEISSLIDNADTINISDIFGDLAFRDHVGNQMSELPFEDMEEDISITGIKFGVRLCYVPPSDLDISRISPNDFSKKEKSYCFESSHGYENSKYIVPICSFEEEMPNGSLKTYIDTDQNMNQNLKCFVDYIADTPEYKLVFDKIFDMKRIPTMLSIYSSLNFYPSLGLGEEERDQEESIGNDIFKVFDNTKSSARKLFIQLYKRKDFDPPDEEDDYNMLKDETKRLMANTLRHITFENEVWPWQKKRIIDKPYDCDGNPCGNSIAKLYEVKKDK